MMATQRQASRIRQQSRPALGHDSEDTSKRSSLVQSHNCLHSTSSNNHQTRPSQTPIPFHGSSTMANQDISNCNESAVQVYGGSQGSGGGGESLKSIVERQQEQLRIQREDLEELRRQLAENTRLTQDFRAELSEIRKNWQTLSQNYPDNNNLDSSQFKDSLNVRLENLTAAYNDIQDRLFEIDKSWKNNVVIYGIPCADNTEEDPLITEDKVRNVLKKLHISREIPITRIARIWYGPDFRGHKPIQVCLANYRDKEEILRKARLLKGSNIYISEDFSRKVREHRHELIKFMKEVKSRFPNRRMTLRYDKLYLGHDVFFFNDRTGRVEQMHQNLDLGTNANPAIGNLYFNEAQDPSWLRRPRSRNGYSRSGTPLSRQNSTSMEDLIASPMRRNGRNTRSARVRRAPLSRSDSLDYDSDSGLVSSSRRYSVRRESQDNYSDTEDGGTPSPTKPRKTVYFKDLPDTDKETPRMLNGTPHFNPYPRTSDAYLDYEEDEAVMTVDTMNRTYSQHYVSHQQPAAITHESKVLPPIQNSQNNVVVPYNHHQIEPVTSVVQHQVSSSTKAGQQLPAILHNSIGKLHMNFVHQKNRGVEIETKERMALEDASHKYAMVPKQDHSPVLSGTLAQAQQGQPNLVPNGHVTNGQPHQLVKGSNGVFRVAMFGEFPINQGVNGHEESEEQQALQKLHHQKPINGHVYRTLSKQQQKS